MTKQLPPQPASSTGPATHRLDGGIEFDDHGHARFGRDSERLDEAPASLDAGLADLARHAAHLSDEVHNAAICLVDGATEIAGRFARRVRHYAALGAMMVLAGCSANPPAAYWNELRAQAAPTPISDAELKRRRVERDAESVAVYRKAAMLQAQFEVGAEKAGAPFVNEWSTCVGAAAGKLAAHSAEPATTIVEAAFGACNGAERRTFDAWAANGGYDLATSLRADMKNRIASGLLPAIVVSRGR